jgi:Uma2 family endonuclease
MPTLIMEVPQVPPPQVPPRKRWTREECAPLAAAGLFEIERLELIDGELISKMGKNRPHAIAAKLIHKWLDDTFGWRFVDSEVPIDVSPNENPRNEPVPDLIVLKQEFSTFRSGNPQPQDLHLVVEISDSTLPFDLSTKAALYARAGIVEYWVLDINGRCLFVHRDPSSGKYASVTSYGEVEALAPLSAPGSEFRVGQALFV